MRIELTTSSLPRKRSTPELHWRSWSGRRGSNPRPSAWKADALPTELLPQFPSEKIFFKRKARSVFYRAFGGRRWIRTTEGINQQIYSLPHLATLVFSQNSLRTFEPMEGIEPTTPRLQITCSGQLSYIGNVVFCPFGRFVSLRDCKGRHYFLFSKTFSSFLNIFSL